MATNGCKLLGRIWGGRLMATRKAFKNSQRVWPIPAEIKAPADPAAALEPMTGWWGQSVVQTASLGQNISSFFPAWLLPRFYEQLIGMCVEERSGITQNGRLEHNVIPTSESINLTGHITLLRAVFPNCALTGGRNECKSQFWIQVQASFKIC